jgi:nitrogen fixation protein NifU and related proteins
MDPDLFKPPFRDPGKRANTWVTIWPVLCYKKIKDQQERKIMHDQSREVKDELQAAGNEDTGITLSQGVIDRWQNPKNWGQIEAPDGVSKIKGPCGETMLISIKVKQGHINDVKFVTDGCATSVASGSMATELALGKTINKARKISPEMIYDGVGGLPEESEHCAILAASALWSAIDNYLESIKAEE